MTHDILQTDIELAMRLVGDHRADDEIIQALVHRGIDPDKAAQLVEELRTGRKVTAETPASLEFRLRRRSRPRHEGPEAGKESPTPRPAAAVRSEPRAEPADQARRSSAIFRRVYLVLVALAVAVVGIFLFQRYRAKTLSTEESGPAANSATASQKGSAAPLVLELRPDGLRLGGSLVTRDNLLPATANLLGVPSRTNQVAETGTVIYAYDQQGVLIYSQPRGGTNSIVLDCEATGGVNGTTSPFTGLIKLGDRQIGPEMDSATLTAIKELELKRPGSSGSVWNGRYHDLDLVFAYLKSTQHLSLVEIDLK